MASCGVCCFGLRLDLIADFAALDTVAEPVDEEDVLTASSKSTILIARRGCTWLELMSVKSPCLLRLPFVSFTSQFVANRLQIGEPDNSGTAESSEYRALFKEERRLRPDRTPRIIDHTMRL
jgi:hypothetical protein